ncbi:MAG: ABC exporter membrane fusion protein [Leptolyngbyaceae cyanobacterium MO_188.B28]|nr:ABC exporter membrane fusion protein [Leptolyngbyaceae cyanobacterium MO_188.B28]
MKKATAKQFPLPRLPEHTGKVMVIFGILVAISPIAFYQTFYARSGRHTTSETRIEQVSATTIVTALGRVEPKDEVIHVSAPTGAEAPRIETLFIKEGDRVEAGQLLAILDSHDRRLADLGAAEKQVQVAQVRLAKVEAGAKIGEINAQKAAIERANAQLREDVAAQAATIRRLESEVRNAASEYQRYESLYQSGAISISQRDSKRLVLDVSQQQLREAEANYRQIQTTLAQQVKEEEAHLDRIAEIRSVDVREAEMEIESAIAAVKQAQAALNLTYVRAPRAGQILKIHTWAGELVGNQGIVALGETNQMYVIAEVYQTDIQHVKVGQRATIASEAMNQPLQGAVEQIGLQIFKRNVLDTDPLADTDGRIVEVKIRLDPSASQAVAGLTNIQVDVAIQQ